MIRGERSRWTGVFLTVSSRHIDRHSHWEETVRTHTPSHSVFMKRIRSAHCILKTQGSFETDGSFQYWQLQARQLQTETGQSTSERQRTATVKDFCYTPEDLPQSFSWILSLTHAHTHSGRTEAAVIRASCLSTSTSNVCLFIYFLPLFTNLISLLYNSSCPRIWLAQWADSTALTFHCF